MGWHSSVRGLFFERTRFWARLALIVAGTLPCGVASADQQRDPELRGVIQRAIAQAECFTDHYDSAVWYTLMEPRLRLIVK